LYGRVPKLDEHALTVGMNHALPARDLLSNAVLASASPIAGIALG